MLNKDYSMTEQNSSHLPNPPVGVLLANLGTPAAPTARAVGRYLREFLWDPRVVDLPRLLWWFILNGAIIPLRSARVARNYQKIWMAEGSPLLVNSQRQALGVQTILNQQSSAPVVVELGMTYGQPSIAAALQKLRAQRVRKLLVLPLYPQYSATTTGAVFDAVARELNAWKWVPELRMVNQYADDVSYIQALVDSVKTHWQQQPRGDCLLISFHGLPERYLREGDPYYCYCHKTARLLAEQLGLQEEQWRLVFQSRFGREPWLQPYCDATLQALPGEGKRNVDIICPGFSADCLETLEEINMTNRKIFIKAGGDGYHYIPALNDQPGHLQAISEIVSKHTMGW
jgi:ferrochelatase